MAWARIDDGFHDHPKVDELSLGAVGLWTLCLTWAHRHRRTASVAGHVTDARVRKVAGKNGEKFAAELVAARLWDVEIHIGGWVIHDFADYLPKQRDPEELRDSGRKGAAKRWQPDGSLPSEGMANDGSRASAPAFPSRPVPNSDSLQGEERPVTLQPVAATQPPPSTPSDARCTAHTAVADPGPCKGCRAAREKAERLTEREAEKARLAAEAAARDCTRCDGVWLLDDELRITRRKCDHRRTA